MNLREAESILGLVPGYAESDVRRAYRAASRVVHPDRGGTDEAFNRVSEAVGIVRAALLSPPPPAPPPPRRTVRDAGGRERDDVHDEAWRRRQHERYGTMDARSSGLGSDASSTWFGVLRLHLDGHAQDPSGWTGRFLERRGTLLASFVSSVPKGTEPRTLDCRISFGEEGEAEMSGPVVEVLVDRAGRVLEVFADLLSGVDLGDG